MSQDASLVQFHEDLMCNFFAKLLTDKQSFQTDRQSHWHRQWLHAPADGGKLFAPSVSFHLRNNTLNYNSFRSWAVIFQVRKTQESVKRNHIMMYTVELFKCDKQLQLLLMLTEELTETSCLFWFYYYYYYYCYYYYIT